MTSRCRTTGKVNYRSKRAAEQALRKVQQRSVGTSEQQHAYRCPDSPSHWHLGKSDHQPRGDKATGVKGGRRDRWTFAEWEQATMVLWARCRDFCERCGLPLRGQMERHHRQVREVGGDRLANLVALHPACHTWVHAHPEEARSLGLIVSRHASDPAEVALTLPDRRAVMLNDEGRYTPT